MKHTIPAVALVSVGIAFGPGNIFAKGSSNSGSGSYSGGHHGSSSSSTTSAVSHFSGAAHFSEGTSYRPQVNFSNGNRTLNYPAVRNSMIRQQLYSGRVNFSGDNKFQGTAQFGLRQRTSIVNGLNSGYALKRSGELGRPGNIAQGTTLRPNRGHRLDPETSTRLRNWNGNISNTQQARLNHLNNCHHHHDHGWWRHHCATIIFFDFGWWGWYDGWWYPAWGYDAYSNYDYNEPIYGYDGESPEQIVAGVQAALQERGYYQYAIDGRMGPLTRAAIARFQTENGLPITSGIDPATLGSLGIVR